MAGKLVLESCSLKQDYTVFVFFVGQKCMTKKLHLCGCYGILGLAFLVPLYKYSTVSGQNRIGRELTLLAFIQPTDDKQNAVYNNWLLQLQPFVVLRNWPKPNFPN